MPGESGIDPRYLKKVPINAVSDLARALDAVANLIESIEERQWSSPTPCVEWDVRAVVDHLLDVQQRFFTNLTGTHARTESTFRANATLLVSAFEEDGALERIVPDRLGDISGLTLLNILLMETLVHGWDLGRALGRNLAFDEEVADRTVEFARMMSPKVPSSLRKFSDPQPVRADAPAIDRLAAFLGRKPGFGDLIPG